ncbi:hypothetical protein ACLOJK_023389 [Asimina triloba]
MVVGGPSLSALACFLVGHWLGLQLAATVSNCHSPPRPSPHSRAFHKLPIAARSGPATFTAGRPTPTASPTTLSYVHGQWRLEPAACKHMLSLREAEHLDWATRLRIVMGMAYCLDHMHQLNPPLLHKSLHSKVVYLCDDYAAKISDFAFWNDETKSKKCSCDTELPTMPSSELKSNVYSFGVILLEMMSGKLPYSENEGSIVDWASDFLSKAQPARHIMDPTLKSFDQEQAKMLLDLIPSCVDADPKKRPSMREVTAQLRDITGITPDAATPRLSPLWWAELEILSSLDAS